MRTLFTSESCKETQLNSINPQSWLQVERGKISKFAPQSASSIESLIKVPESQVLPHYKPVDYLEVLAQIHEELESCPPEERSNLYLLQYRVFKGVGEAKLMTRSLRSAWLKASTVYEKIVFGQWIKYVKQGEDIISDLLSPCRKCQEFRAMEIASEVPVSKVTSFPCTFDDTGCPRIVSFRIGDKNIACDRLKIAGLSAPFHAMLNWSFTEALCDDINLSENNISPSGMMVINKYSTTGNLNEISPDLL